MNITTKFDIGDSVYLIKDGKIMNVLISGILIEVTPLREINLKYLSRSAKYPGYGEISFYENNSNPMMIGYETKIDAAGAWMEEQGFIASDTTHYTTTE